MPLPIMMLMAWSFFNSPKPDLEVRKDLPKVIYTSALPDTLLVKPQSVQFKKALAVTNILNGNHYTRKKLDDDMSLATYKDYLESLDNGKLYFMASDIKSFDKYSKALDDYLKQGDIAPVYDIFNVYKERALNRIEKVLKVIETMPLDFSKDEILETDGKKRAWANTEADLDEEWRKQIKNQMLNLHIGKKKETEIRSTIKKRYENYRKSIKQINSEDVFQIFMNCLTESYDPHTTYFSPISSQNFNMNMSRSFEGIGARLRSEEDYVTIDEIMAGGPAFRGKELKAGDRIVGVAQGDNGEYEDIVGWRLDDAILLIRGQKGTTVRLKIIPAGASLSTPPKEVKLVREKIKTEEETIKKKVITQTHNGKTYKIGVIEVPSFYIDFKEYQAGNPDYKSTSRDTKKALKELQEEGVQGIIMDLRNNGGGSLKEAIDLTGLFIKTGPVVQVRDVAGRIEANEDDDDEIAYNGPLAVMVNGFSASASEIFSAAIQDYKRGVIIGEQTYGKGTVQQPVDLSRFVKGEKGDQHGHINITLSKYYRINGSSTQNLGVKPDIALPDALDRSEFGEASERATLPSDEIKTAKYTVAGNLTEKMIDNLRKSYEKRLKNDAELKGLVKSIEDLRKLRQNTKISLNETKRKQEIDEYEKKAKEKAILEDEENGAEGDTNTNAESKIESKKAKKDLYIQNAAQVLADWIGMQPK